MDEEETGQVWVRPVQKWDLVVLGLFFIRGITEALDDVATAAYGVAAAHSNHKNNQRLFHEEVAQTIERLTGDE